MARILVLYPSGAADVPPVADALAKGARSVRFAEVDVRRLERAGEALKEHQGAPAAKHRALDSIETLTEYDAVVLAPGGEGEQAFAEALGRSGPLADVVGAVAGTSPALLAAMGRLGMVLLTGDDPESLGRRAAKVAGWVRHAKGHEAEGDHHGHHHHHHDR